MWRRHPVWIETISDQRRRIDSGEAMTVCEAVGASPSGRVDELRDGLRKGPEIELQVCTRDCLKGQLSMLLCTLAIARSEL